MLLIDEPYESGEVQKSFDLNNLNDGIYYVHTDFTGEQSVTNSKKLILIH